MHWFTVPLTLQWHSHLPCTGPQHRHFALHRERALANWQQGTDGTVRTQSCDCPPASNRGCRGAPLWRALQWNSPPLVPVLTLSPLLLPHLFTPVWKWLSITDNPVLIRVDGGKTKYFISSYILSAVQVENGTKLLSPRQKNFERQIKYSLRLRHHTPLSMQISIYFQN